MTSRSDDRADEATELVAEMRAAVEDATRKLERMTDEVAEHRAGADRLESMVDLLLDLTDEPVIAIDLDRRITAVSRAAAHAVEGATVGKPLSSVLPEPLAEQLVTYVQGLRHGAGGSSTIEGVRVYPLPGGAMLVLPDR